jgi:hypothetical protein
MYPLFAYAFTDFKAQGQTIEHVIMDLAQPPTGTLTHSTLTLRHHEAEAEILFVF